MRKRLRKLFVIISLLITGWLGGQQFLTPSTPMNPCPYRQSQDQKVDKLIKIVHNKYSQLPLIIHFFKDFDLF
ncbi:hypothetical protein JCM31185_04940 [Furfurilactobacillus curtus]|uniref:Uncharacterized protein n=1 Tax=Furfurilactobacillus curtus TaxID=1746200 RepID=A0ABQ5JMJ8_9LACO